MLSSSVILLLVFFALSICFSFLCSILEAVLLSVTPNYVRRAQQDGTSTGQLLEKYKEDIDRPLSAILTLNTIAHTVGAIGVGAQAGNVFDTGSYFLGLSAESWVAGIMTLAILILSEIIPKTIGANNWQALTPFTVKTIQILLWILSPLVWLSQLITKSLKKEKEKAVLTRMDFLSMTLDGEKDGTLDKNESKIIKNLLDFTKLSVRDIMTPKTVTLIADEDQTIDEFYKKNQPLRHSRIPTYKESSDNITGMILKDDLLKMLADDKHSTALHHLRRPVHFIPDALELPKLFKELTEERRHLSIVNDEFGNIVGIVTMEDLFETLLGVEILDESDNVADLQELAKKRWEEKIKTNGTK